MIVIQPRIVVIGTTDSSPPSLDSVTMEPHLWARVPRALYGRILVRLWEVRTSGGDEMDFLLNSQPGFENQGPTGTFPGTATDLLGSSLKGLRATSRMSTGVVTLDPRTAAQTASTMLYWRINVTDGQGGVGTAGNWSVMFDVVGDFRS